MKGRDNIRHRTFRSTIQARPFFPYIFQQAPSTSAVRHPPSKISLAFPRLPRSVAKQTTAERWSVCSRPSQRGAGGEGGGSVEKKVCRATGNFPGRIDPFSTGRV